MSLKIALLPGDGIGPEVTDEASRILKYVAEHRGAVPSALLLGLDADEWKVPDRLRRMKRPHLLNHGEHFFGVVPRKRFTQNLHHGGFIGLLAWSKPECGASP